MKIKDGFTGQRSVVLPKIVIDSILHDTLASQLYITDIGHYPHAMFHHRVREVPLDQYIFIYCVDGKGHCRVNNNTYEILSNQFIILPAGLAHEYWSDIEEPWTIYWMHFSGNMAQEYAEGLSTPQNIYISDNSRISDRIEIFEKLLENLYSWQDTDKVRYSSSLLHHFLGSLKYISQYRGETTNSMDIAQSAMHFISENMERHISVEEIAEYVGKSVTQLSLIFKKKTGYSLINYINLEKIRKSVRLLDETDWKINQISSKVGISDPYYFSRLFTSVMGMSPRNYRQRVRF